MTRTSSMVFIVGCPRSGTSWLFQMLAKHPDCVAVPGESHAYSIIYDPLTYLPNWSWKQRLQAARPLIRQYGIRSLIWGVTGSDIWRSLPNTYQIYRQGKNNVGLHHLADFEQFQALYDVISQQPITVLEKAERLIAHLFTAFLHRKTTALATEASPFLLEKTPLHLRYADKILTDFPDAKVIEIIRDGRDVDVSNKARAKTQRWAQQETADVIRQWLRCIKLGQKLKADSRFSGRIHRTYYEAMRLHPAQEIEKIFRFLGVPFSEALITELVAASEIGVVKVKGEGRHVRKGTIGEWQVVLSPEEKELWQQSAGAVLRRLGYE